MIYFLPLSFISKSLGFLFFLSRFDRPGKYRPMGGKLERQTRCGANPRPEPWMGITLGLRLAAPSFENRHDPISVD